MSIVGGSDIHRKQVTFDYLDVETGQVERGRIAPADRAHLADWLHRFDGVDGVAFAMEGCTGWRYVAEEMRAAGVAPHLAEPADTSVLRGPKRRAKTDLLTELRAGSGSSGRRGCLGGAMFRGHDRRRGWVEGSFWSGGGAVRVSAAHGGLVRAVPAG
jgi:hypothetical protein